MIRVQCDILIIGAGPAGTSAAAVAAKAGCHVVVVERRPCIGLPVRCAEYIPAPLVAEINLGSDYIAQSIEGMRSYFPDGEVKYTRTPGFTIERDVFDILLAKASEREGADIWLSAAAKVLENNSVIVHRKGSEFSIQAKVIIGADGPKSKVGKWIKSPNQNLLVGAQVLAPIDNYINDTEVYFDQEIYCGYGWVFPKYDFANVGIGIKPDHPKRWSAKKVLDNFIQKLIREEKILPPADQRYIAGWIPVEPIKKVHHGNIILVGDAAGHTHPITGAGIFSAVTGGRLAGKWAAEAINENNLLLLAEYEKEIYDFFGPHLKRAYDRRCFMEDKWDDFAAIIKQSWIAFREYYE
jgi:geranylgeranyl reductase family protein